MTVSNRRLAFSTLATGGGNFLKICIQLVMLPLMARLLGPDEYGLYSLAMPIIMFMMMLADGGLGASLAREPESNDAVWSSAFWALLISGFVMAAIVVVSSFFLAAAAHQPRLPFIIMALSPCVVLFVLSVPAGTRLVRRARLEVIAFGDVLGNVLGAGCAIVLALHHAGAWSLVAQTSVIYFIRFLVVNIAAPVLPRFHLSIRDLSSHLTMGGTIIGGKLVDTGDKSVENALMGRNFGAAQLGTFSVANQIPAFLCGAVSNAIWATLYTQTIRAADDAEVIRNYRNMVRVMALLLFPMAALIAAEGEQLIGILLGNRWGNVSPMLEVFLISSTLMAIGVFGQSVLYAKGFSSIQFRIAIEVAFIRILFVAAAPWIGINGVIIGLAAASCYASCRNLESICRLIGVRIVVILEQMIWPAVSATIAGVVCWFVAQQLPFSLLPISINLAAGLAFYLLLLLAFERQALFNDLLNARKLMWR
jgi:O-antigen/teichoic acid export membrane protein